MGIQGLIPFLEKSSRQVNISQYSGCTVAIDAYCWLHKGAFSCADKLARGDKTDAYVKYCMKYVNMLLSHNIKPILVFDGRHLPAKADTEKKRRQNREVNRRRAAELLRLDKPNEARTFLQRCIDVTHIMAVELMREARARNVDCITAPYEADAQLAYLNINNIAHIVVTEDSDLLLFGCTKVMFKLDLNGNCLLVEQESLHLSLGLSKGCFSMEKFRHMCILSGCDYLASLPKIGLAKACRFVKSTVDPDIHRALSRLGGHLNMNIVVPLEYRDKFVAADAMFRHQPVFDPLTRRLVPLTPLPPGATPPTLLSEEKLSQEQLLQLALGNLDPFTLKEVDNWIPGQVQKPTGRTDSWSVAAVARHKSIWSEDYQPTALVIGQPDSCQVKRTSTCGQVVERSAHIPKLQVKRPILSTEEEVNALRSQFGAGSPNPAPKKKPRYDNEEILQLLDKTDSTPPKTEDSHLEVLESPKKSSHNPFSKETQSEKKFSGLSKLAQFRRTGGGDTGYVQSRYFHGNRSLPLSENESSKPQNETLRDVSNVIEKQSERTEKVCEVKTHEKLSDTRITTVIEDLEDVEKVTSNSNGKENISGDSPNLKHETTFKWKPSLADMFGFKSKTLPSPSTNNSKFTISSQDNSRVEENTSTTEHGKSTSKRNPFAKAKTVECLSSVRPQKSSHSKELQSSSSTPELSSNDSNARMDIPAPSTTPKPQMKIGLSKNSCQKSLLTMFAFKPKAKLQK